MTDPATVITQGFAHLNDHDISAYCALMAPDVLSKSPMGTLSSRAEVEETFTANLDLMPDNWRTVDRLIVDGPTVVAQLTFGGTIAATGKSFEIEVCTVYEVPDGVITSIAEYADWRPLLEAFVTE
jgi:ketosteroid isomerase-like protein